MKQLPAKQLITHSCQATFKECRRKYYYSYELKLRRIDDARALRMGSAGHSGVAALGEGKSIDLACAAVRSHYERMLEHFDTYEWAIECETMLRLVCAYQWRWAGHPLEYIEVEKRFQLPLINPSTGAPTPIFDKAGKRDGIVRMEDGRLAVKETKFLGDDIGPDSPLWRRLRMDQQISMYIGAAREQGINAATVLYDVIRKPTIKPEQVPILDGLGMKIVLDANGDRVTIKGGKPRQTASKEDGYVLQTRPMTPAEWGEKLTADICERPDYYFARVEIPRMDQDIDEFAIELWETQKVIRDAQLNNRWFRTVGKNSCGFCSYFDICSTNQTIDAGNPPMGFEILSDCHPELALEDSHVSDSSSTETATCGPTAATAECATVA